MSTVSPPHRDLPDTDDVAWLTPRLVDRYPQHRRQHLQLVWCPACGAQLWTPGTGPSRVADHIATHEPADFGLCPLGERREEGTQ